MKPDLTLYLSNDGQQTNGMVCLEFVSIAGLHYLQLPCDLIKQSVFADNTQEIQLSITEELEYEVQQFADTWYSTFEQHTGVSAGSTVPDMAKANCADWPMSLIDLHVGYGRRASPAHEFTRLAGVNNLFLCEADCELIVLRSCLEFHEQVSVFNELMGWTAEVDVNDGHWRLRNLMAVSGLTFMTAQDKTPQLGIAATPEDDEDNNVSKDQTDGR